MQPGKLISGALNAVWRMVAVVIILLAVYIALGRQLLPMASDYRLHAAGYLSTLTGFPIQIGELEGSWTGFRPSLVARDVRAGPDLSIGEIRLDLSVLPTIASGQPIARYLEMKNLRIRLEQQAEQAGWRMGNMAFRSDAQQQPIGAQNLLQRLSILLSHDAVVVRDFEIQLTFDQLESLNITLNSGEMQSFLNQRKLAVDVTLQSSTQQSSLTMLGQISDWQDNADARFYFKQESFDWSPWLSVLPIPVDVQTLQSRSEIWLDLEDGQISKLHSRVDIPQLAIAREDLSLELSNIYSEVSLERQEDAIQFWLRDLQFVFQGEQWQPSLHQVHWNQQGVELLSDRVDIQLLSNLATLLSPNPVLPVLKPAGVLNNSRLVWYRNEPIEDSLVLQGRFSDLQLSPWQGIPGLSDVNGYLDMTPGRGQITLQPSDVVMSVPKVWSTALPLKQMTGQFNWTWHPQLGVVLTGSNLYAQPDGMESIQGQFTMLSPPKSQWDYREPRIEMQVSFKNASQDVLDLYLPNSLDAHSRQWVIDSTINSTIRQGTVQVSSPLVKAPRIAQNNLVYLDLEDSEIRFQPDWPTIEQLQGKLLISNDGLTGRFGRGRFFDLDLTDIEVGLAFERGAKVQVQGKGTGDMSQVLRLVRETPLRELVSGQLDQWQAQGSASAKLALSVPLDDQSLSANLAMQVTDGTLVMPQYELAISELSGQINYTDQRGLYAEQVAGHFFGQPAEFSLYTQDNGSRVKISADSSIRLEDLGVWLGDPLLIDIGGKTEYQARIDISGDQARLDISTDLVGVSIPSPAPLTKLSAETWPTQIRLDFLADGRTHLMADLDQRFSAAFQFGPEWFVEHGMIATGKGAEIPSEDGIFMNFSLSTADGDYWWDEVERVVELYSTWPAADDGKAVGPTFEEQIREIDIQLDEIVFLNESWSNADIMINRDPEGWAARYKAEGVQGTLGYGHGESDPLIVDIEYLNLVSETPPENEQEEELPREDPLADFDPKQLPLAIIEIKRLSRNEKDMGAWTFQIEPTDQGARIHQIDGLIRGLQTQGELRWYLNQDKNLVTEIEGQASTTDIGRVLELWGYTKNIESSRGEMDVLLTWEGSPLAFDMKYVEGRVYLELLDGAFLNVEEYEGIRLFGVFNFSRLLRRVALDFRDIIREGISYDIISGELWFEDGFAMIGDHLFVDGSSSKFRFNGGYDLLSERLDVDMVFTIPLSSALPFAALIAGVTPQVALGIYVTERFMNNELESFSSVKYRVTGTLTEPELELYRAFDNQLDTPPSFTDRIRNIFGGDR